MKSLLLLLFLSLPFCFSLEAKDVSSAGMRPSLVKREDRKSLIVTEYGQISAVDISTGTIGDYHLEFITLEPNSLFLPVILHSDMVFYVNTGSGRLSWAEGGKELKRMDIKKGDVYRLHPGSVFFMQSNLETERKKLRIYAIFSNADEGTYEPHIGAYSSINDLVLGFDTKLLQSAFKVPEEVIEEMKSAMRPPDIVHAAPQKKSILLEIEDRLLQAFVGNKDGTLYSSNGGHKKTKKVNLLDGKPDFENCNGWSVTVDKKDLKRLKGSGISVFMVNLTKGSMMGPHWNPMANEIAVVLQGLGMVRVVCSSNVNETECKNMRFRVQEGDVFAIPRFHPMAQMAFNNESLVFMGFSTSTSKNDPQFLAGKRSVFQTLNKEILALSFNVPNTTVDKLLNPQEEEIILECISCAEEEERKMEEEMEREREREEEEARKREEEERKRKEEEARKREEEEARKREEEERRREEEEAREREEEEEERKREEERRREEEEAREREEEEEERKREEEEREKREMKERKKRERKEAERRQREERRRRESEARREQEQARKEEEERQRRQRQREEEAKEREREREVQPEEEIKRSEESEEEKEGTRKQEREYQGDSGPGKRALRKVWKL
ncbi:hypothetical protein JCGZ_12256 [Jatropha curcas]|uniref:Cupin type-1 domain-containing protein n=1 Tax=Jatropha curcas TaxID=180498 RepID=A0A067KHS0_JATCU|nr:hypothetical protein JCGZ_12256 [Jatropha curcas]